MSSVNATLPADLRSPTSQVMGPAATGSNVSLSNAINAPRVYQSCLFNIANTWRAESENLGHRALDAVFGVSPPLPARGAGPAYAVTWANAVSAAPTYERGGAMEMAVEMDAVPSAGQDVYRPGQPAASGTTDLDAAPPKNPHSPGAHVDETVDWCGPGAPERAQRPASVEFPSCPLRLIKVYELPDDPKMSLSDDTAQDFDTLKAKWIGVINAANPNSAHAKILDEGLSIPAWMAGYARVAWGKATKDEHFSDVELAVEMGVNFPTAPWVPTIVNSEEMRDLRDLILEADVTLTKELDAAETKRGKTRSAAEPEDETHDKYVAAVEKSIAKATGIIPQVLEGIERLTNQATDPPMAFVKDYETAVSRRLRTRLTNLSAYVAAAGTRPARASPGHVPRVTRGVLDFANSPVGRLLRSDFISSERAALTVISHYTSAAFEGNGTNAIKAESMIELLTKTFAEIEAAPPRDRGDLVLKAHPNASAVEFAMGIFSPTMHLIKYLSENLNVVTKKDLTVLKTTFFKMKFKVPFDVEVVLATYKRDSANLRRAQELHNQAFDQTEATGILLEAINPSAADLSSSDPEVFVWAGLMREVVNKLEAEFVEENGKSPAVKEAEVFSSLITQFRKTVIPMVKKWRTNHSSSGGFHTYQRGKQSFSNGEGGNGAADTSQGKAKANGNSPASRSSRSRRYKQSKVALAMAAAVESEEYCLRCGQAGHGYKSCTNEWKAASRDQCWVCLSTGHQKMNCGAVSPEEGAKVSRERYLATRGDDDKKGKAAKANYTAAAASESKDNLNQFVNLCRSGKPRAEWTDDELDLAYNLGFEVVGGSANASGSD